MFVAAFIFAVLQFSLAYAASCPDGSYEWQDSCFYFESNATGFALAETTCTTVFGGQLASIHDGFTNVLIAQILNLWDVKGEVKRLCEDKKISISILERGTTIFKNTTNIWIGLTDTLFSKNWTWIDGTTLDFTAWATNEPANNSEFNCAELNVTNGLWKSDDCFKIKPFVCRISPGTLPGSTPASSSAQPITSTTSGGTRPTFTLDPTCVSTSINMYLNYFFDTGDASGEVFNLYNDILTETSGEADLWTQTQLLSIYAANANGSSPAAVAFTELQTLQNELYALLNPPWFTSSTSSVTNDLTYYQSVLSQQLPYPATPVIVMFLRNPVDDVNASIAKMNAVRYANPQTYIMGVFFIIGTNNFTTTI